MEERSRQLNLLMANRIATRENLLLLKRRRDALISRSCTRQEQKEVMEEVRLINREVHRLLGEIGEAS